LIRTYEAHPIKINGVTMDVKVHGGSVITVPKIKGVKYTTLLVVLMEPGAKTAEEVLTKEQFNLLTSDMTSHFEHVDKDISVEPEYDTGFDWDGSLPVS
jgi:hypothetical protein